MTIGVTCAAAAPRRLPRESHSPGAAGARVLALFVLVIALGATRARAGTRVEVGWISLEPRLPPPNHLAAPPQEGWPLEGDAVRWVAHLLNRGADTVPGVVYAWAIDDGTSQSGKVDLFPGETTLTLAWTWTFARHHVSLRITPPAESGDASVEDDELTVVSNALSLGLGVEQDVYDWALEAGRPGFERLMQREIVKWNALLARAVHPSTPRGALDRIRLEAVLLRPDDTGPQHGDFSTDLRWFFSRNRTDPRFLWRGMDPRHENDQTIVLHELLHQRGLTDLYAYAVFHGDIGLTDSRVDIVENGTPVAGTFLMPSLNPASSVITVYRLPYDGLMGSRIRSGANATEHSTFGLNLWAGRRSPQWFDRWGNLILGLGNAVNPYTYLSRLPRTTELRLKDQDGAAIPAARVEVYLDHSPHAYQKLYRSQPDRIIAGDTSGTVPLPGDILDDLPFKHDAPPKSLVIIVGVKTAAARGYAFIPVADLNLLHFRGAHEHGELELTVKMFRW